MGYVDWACFGLPSSVEMGMDGFPRPGKAARWYREQNKQADATWTQKRLAQELGLTERAVCYLESHDVELDSIALRRRLALLFNIPPLLFGLASLEDETNLGQTVKLYRKMKPKDHPLRSQRGRSQNVACGE
jgi:transcriptional regulator with XRE-family HTH domain